MKRKIVIKLLCSIIICLNFAVPGKAQLIEVKQDFSSYGCVKDVDAIPDYRTALNEVEPCRSVQNIDLSDKTYIDGLSSIIKPLEFKYSSGNLTFYIYEKLDCVGQSLTPTIKRSGNVIWLHTEIFTGENGYFACSCTKKYESTIKGVAPGLYYIITNDAVYRTELFDDIEKELTLSDMLTCPFTLRDDAEWVYYRERGINDAPQFIRMRLVQEKTSGVKRYNVYYCDGDFNQDKAINVGFAHMPVPSSIKLSSILLNNNLLDNPGGSVPILSQGVQDWNNPGCELGVYPIYNFNSSPTITWDFAKWWAQYPNVTDIKETTVDGLPSLHYLFDNGLELVYGVGPVGCDYASNMMYPAFELPEGEAPLRFLYMRSLKDNHIIYGDPTLDSSYKGSDKLTEAADKAWIENALEFGIDSEGEAEVTVYSPNGMTIASQIGHGRVTIERSLLETGIYIVTAVAPGFHLTRKLIIP